VLPKIAFDSGLFNDLSNFSKHFKRDKNIIPPLHLEMLFWNTEKKKE